MGNGEDSYVAMLLTLALSPDKEEYARPLTTAEFRRLEERVRRSPFQRLGGILQVDISGLMMKLEVPEETAYRLYTLLNRGIQLNYALEGYYNRGIRVVTQFDAGYPRRLTQRLGDAAPPALYMAGAEEVTEAPKMAISGIGGVRTTQEARDAVETLVRNAARLGFCVLTGGEPGVSHVAADFAARYDCPLAEVLGGGMGARVSPGGREVPPWAAISPVHPDAPFTVPHAAARNRVLFALADAAFVFNTDGKRGETEALTARYCDNLYAWRGHPSAAPLISRGAIGFDDPGALDFDALAGRWKGARAEQLSIFDLMGGDGDGALL